MHWILLSIVRRGDILLLLLYWEGLKHSTATYGLYKETEDQVAVRLTGCGSLENTTLVESSSYSLYDIITLIMPYHAVLISSLIVPLHCQNGSHVHNP